MLRHAMMPLRAAATQDAFSLASFATRYMMLFFIAFTYYRLMPRCY